MIDWFARSPLPNMCKNGTSGQQSMGGEESSNDNYNDSVTPQRAAKEPTTLAATNDAATLVWPEEDDHKKTFLQNLVKINNWTYSYMNPILAKGSRQKRTGQTLTETDLFPAPSHMRSTVLAATFRQYYCHDDAPMPVSRTRRMLRALWAVAKPTFVPAGVCELVALSCQVAMPLLVRELLQLLEQKSTLSLSRDRSVQQGIGCTC